MSLYLKYRPKTLAEVIGQKAVVRSLERNLKDKLNHAFLFTGQSGTGKTTLARIACTILGATDPKQIKEVDAATYTGIDDVRTLKEAMAYKPIGVSTMCMCIIIDECHALSAAAWKALLKLLEEPPSWAYIFLCTTEPTRVPQNIRTRCTTYSLQPVDRDTLFDWLNGFDSKDNILSAKDEKEAESIIDACCKMAEGSPRQALVNLAACAAAKTVKEARELLRSSETKKEAVELARLLVGGGSYQQVQSLLGALGETNPESIRHVVRGYVTKVALGAGSEKQWAHCLKVLDAFSEPFNSSDGMTPIVLATGRALFT